MKQQRELTPELRSAESRFLLKGMAFVATALLLFNGCKKEPAEIATINSLEADSIIVDTLPCGNFRTQTQGGWGSTPQGNNPGTYLHANFAGAFPTGLSVGCTYSLLFTSAQAITDYLPDGGPAIVLTQNYTNPVKLKNVLASQIVALSLSVRFDAYDPAFGGSSVALGDLIIVSGTFAGMSVNAVLAEANKVLGGCISIYTLSDMVEVISSINQNFVDGTINGGFLQCPSEGGPW
ncbi:MAG: hypothetical protein H0W84_00790 [Bacteroidetes bacterium]|nr:hypothetical protein [Bacteroidota bacterium]